MSVEELTFGSGSTHVFRMFYFININPCLYTTTMTSTRTPYIGYMYPKQIRQCDIDCNSLLLSVFQVTQKNTKSDGALVQIVYFAPSLLATSYI